MNETPQSSHDGWIPLPIVDTTTARATTGRAADESPYAGVDPHRFWRSLDEACDSDEFAAAARREFPAGLGEWTHPVERRDFLRLSAASLGLAGLGGCMRQPEEKIVPYVRQPEDFTPGRPLEFATAATLGGYAVGVLVESRLGRPTTLAGNPLHPASRGAMDPFTQASLLGLYDPDRSQTVRKGDLIATWGDFLSALAEKLTTLRERRGRGLVILTGAVTSPTLGEQLKALLTDLPEARWRRHEPLGRDHARAASQAAFGELVETIYHFERAEVVVSLDADFFVGMPGNLRYARDFASRRTVVGDDPTSGSDHARRSATLCRAYAIESTPTLYGAVADHRLPLRAAQIEAAARQLAAALDVVDLGSPSTSTAPPIPDVWLRALVADLQAHRGASLIVAGDGQPPIVHVIAHALNRALGNVGTTVEYVEPIEIEPPGAESSLRTLADEIRRGEVEALIVVGGNPAYDAPGELGFVELFDRVPWRVHLSEYFDETSARSHWHLPQAHYLETWSDARAFDGTTTVQQPLIAPLYGGKSPHELLAAVAGKADQSAFAIVRESWRRRLGDDDFERRMRRVMHDGVAADTQAKRREPMWKYVPASKLPSSSETSNGLELVFTPDPTIWDGRYANNGWLQELPKPLTKLTWENVALVAPQTAARLQWVSADVVRIAYAGRALEVPVWIVPGQPVDSISLSLGYGRTRAGRVGNGAGVNAYALLPASGVRFVGGVEIGKTGARAALAVTQNHHSMEGRDLVRVQTLEAYRGDGELIDHESRHPEAQPTLYPPVEQSADAWGMTIDQSACIGCSGCVVACQAENNIPIVGKEQVAIGREMHWIRVDRYYRGAVEEPETYFQPVPCMHCENAPCELVCPVAATVHSHEGLNQMVYNRCVGTRYCSNNCPYKVRRFNFFDYRAKFGYEGKQAAVLELLHNPEVTVRTRGVMEKCTYCVQRINAAKITAQKENRPVRDGEIVTACQAACPTQAITFGNIRDSTSRVAARKHSPLNYSLLAELNAVPRTTYLAVVRNPNGAIGEPSTVDTPTGDPASLDFGEGKKS